MKIDKNLWIEGGYYIDFDKFNQFRIIGPNNHLYCGLIDIPRHKIQIKKINLINDWEINIKGSFLDNQLNLYYPAMDDIRTTRLLAENITFLEARKIFSDRLVPLEIKKYKKEKETYLKFSRHYGNKYYQTIFIFSKDITVNKINKPFKGFQIKINKKENDFQIIVTTNDLSEKQEVKKFFMQDFKDLKAEVFGKEFEKIKYIWKRTEVEIKHLINWGKTSGDRFGTVFPRDWMESADIGIHDLTPETRSCLYQVSLKNVNAKGEGWHEDVVGEFKYEYEISGKDILDRHMIDIEPHYLIGLERLPEDFLVNPENRKKLCQVAKFILKQAKSKEFITFKKLPLKQKTSNQKYYISGNWRDSEWAFKKIHPLIAPFDVNAVFYPKALAIIKKFQKKLEIKEPTLDNLIKKWQKKKEFYQFKNFDNKIAYALAIYDIKKRSNKLTYKKLKVNHLDESYLYTYESGTPQEIKSFCQRLLDPNYFYTPLGPMLIAKNNNLGYTNQEYHGLVIWLKQTAFVILGLSKHLKLATTENWPKDLQKLIKKTIKKICLDTISAIIKLNAIPETYYLDNKGKIKLFPEQSKVQLWSAVAIRRIIRKYIELETHPVYKKI